MSKCDGPTHLVDSTYSVLLVIISSVVFLSCSILSSALSSAQTFIDMHHLKAGQDDEKCDKGGQDDEKVGQD